MRRTQAELRLPGGSPPRRNDATGPCLRSRLYVGMMVGLLVVASPLLYEGGLRIYANWSWMAGRPIRVETPVLEALGNLITRELPTTLAAVWDGISPLFASPVQLLPFAVCGLGLGFILLKRG